MYIYIYIYTHTYIHTFVICFVFKLSPVGAEGGRQASGKIVSCHGNHIKAIRYNAQYMYRHVCIYIYIYIYIHTHTYNNI